MPIYNLAYGIQTIPPTPSGWTPTSNTIGYWELDGNAEDTKNDYGVTTYTSTDYDSDGYVGAGNPTYTTGRNGKQCAVFDGTRGLQLPGLPIPSNTLTISAWVNYTSAQGGNFGTGSCIFQLRTDNSAYQSAWALFFRIKANGTLTPMMLQTPNPSGTPGQAGYEFTGTALSTGTWHNVVYTFNGGVAKFYLDGSLMQTLSNTSKPYLRNESATKCYIGATSEWSGNQYYAYLTGKIQDVIYENVTWSDQDVADYYANY